MLFVTAQPESLAAAASNLAGIGVVGTAPSAAANAPAAGVNIVATEELSVPAPPQAGAVIQRLPAGSAWSAATTAVHPFAAQ
ncbi:PE domain-containing protein [Mycobacterium sp. 852002-51163_SCH5372311]|uniref:PE domain-containing protein n=1 Tax=Mycobacterium sp. 852002-51163_SCH5372311 TaxID=1834097 RepID=UPI0008325910|nr:PE domain-containing protein [Mycobacterium sp. 852002-51163_SCH5372311]